MAVKNRMPALRTVQNDDDLLARPDIHVSDPRARAASGVAGCLAIIRHTVEIGPENLNPGLCRAGVLLLDQAEEHLERGRVDGNLYVQDLGAVRTVLQIGGERADDDGEGGLEPAASVLLMEVLERTWMRLSVQAPV
jgi:hypothetical protein